MGNAVDDALIGRTLDRGYRIVEQIASGGMGRIYRAEQMALGRSVAVKVIHPWLVGDEMSVSRFVTEARAASRLQHPHSVAIHDFGETDEHLLYLVMELLRGEDLGRMVARTGPLPIPRVVDIAQQALGALDEAHALSVVHRDIKPENFFMETTRSGHDRVKLVDFGIAMIRSALLGRKSTMPGKVCGTPEYMSPEQASGEPLDGRSDLYSVGVVLYEQLTGQLPFERADRAAIAIAHIREMPRDPRVVAPERRIPDALAAVVLRTLSKRPEDRPATARELGEALQDALTARACPPRRTSATVATMPASTRRRASRSRAMMLAVGAAAAQGWAQLASLVVHAGAAARGGEPLAVAAATAAAGDAPRTPAAAVASVELESPHAPHDDAPSRPSAPPRASRSTRSTRAVVPVATGRAAAARPTAKPWSSPPPRIYKVAAFSIAAVPCSFAARALSCAACGARR